MVWGDLCRPGSLVYPACLSPQARSTVQLAPAHSPFPPPLPPGLPSAWFSALPIVFGIMFAASSIVGVAVNYVNYGRAYAGSRIRIGREDSEAESVSDDAVLTPPAFAEPPDRAPGGAGAVEAASAPLKPGAEMDAPSLAHADAPRLSADGAAGAVGLADDGDRPMPSVSRSDTSLSGASTVARACSMQPALPLYSTHGQADSHELPNMEMLCGNAQLRTQACTHTHTHTHALAHVSMRARRS
jgi:hypothetical protein